MPLKIFNADTFPAGGRNYEPGFGMYVSSGQIIINRLGCELLELKAGDQIEFAQDSESTKNWYVSKVKEKGYLLKEKANEHQLQTCSQAVVQNILHSAKINNAKSGRVRFAAKPIKLEGRTWWPLDLSLLKNK